MSKCAQAKCRNAEPAITPDPLGCESSERQDSGWSIHTPPSPQTAISHQARGGSGVDPVGGATGHQDAEWGSWVRSPREGRKGQQHSENLAKNPAFPRPRAGRRAPTKSTWAWIHAAPPGGASAQDLGLLDSESQQNWLQLWTSIHQWEMHQLPPTRGVSVFNVSVARSPPP